MHGGVFNFQHHGSSSLAAKLTRAEKADTVMVELAHMPSVVRRQMNTTRGSRDGNELSGTFIAVSQQEVYAR